MQIENAKQAEQNVCVPLLSIIKRTVSRDFRPLKKKKNLPWPNMNRQKRFRKIYCFREDIRENPASA